MARADTQAYEIDELRVASSPERKGHINPLLYSCMENPMDEEPGGLSLWGHKESNTTE